MKARESGMGKAGRGMTNRRERWNGRKPVLNGELRKIRKRRFV
jgi:hypothetical protein